MRRAPARSAAAAAAARGVAASAAAVAGDVADAGKGPIMRGSLGVLPLQLLPRFRGGIRPLTPPAAPALPCPCPSLTSAGQEAAAAAQVQGRQELQGPRKVVVSPGGHGRPATPALNAEGSAGCRLAQLRSCGAGLSLQQLTPHVKVAMKRDRGNSSECACLSQRPTTKAAPASGRRSRQRAPGCPLEKLALVTFGSIGSAINSSAVLLTFSSRGGLWQF